MLNVLIYLSIVFVFWPGIPSADIYSFVDKQGVTHFTNVQKSSKNNKILAGHDRYALNQGRQQSPEKPEKRYHQIINSASRKYDIEPSLVKAVIAVESNWNSRAVSRKGAQGLMQLMPSTAKNLNVRNPFNPEENIHGGTRYLKSLLEKFQGDLSLALAAYNAGPGRIERFGGIPPIPETQKYVKKVLSLYRGDMSTPIYKVRVRDGTVLYTNTPSSYNGTNLSQL